jgi:hypothetical protein
LTKVLKPLVEKGRDDIPLKHFFCSVFKYPSLYFSHPELREAIKKIHSGRDTTNSEVHIKTAKAHFSGTCLCKPENDFFDYNIISKEIA